MTVLSYVLGMMVPPLILCIIWTAVEIPEPRLEDDHFDNDKIVYRCDGDSCRIFEGVMIGLFLDSSFFYFSPFFFFIFLFSFFLTRKTPAYCGCLLAMGTFFAFQARKAVSHFNEAKYIGSLSAIFSLLFFLPPSLPPFPHFLQKQGLQSIPSVAVELLV